MGHIGLDVPPLIEKVLERVAKDLNTGTSHGGAYLLAQALIRDLQTCSRSSVPRAAPRASP